MKLITAIKKAQKKANERYGEVTYIVKRKYGHESFDREYISVCLNVCIDGYFEVEDLEAKDWIIEEDL